MSGKRLGLGENPRVSDSGWALLTVSLLPPPLLLCLQTTLPPSSSAPLVFAPIYLSLVVLRRYNLV